MWDERRGLLFSDVLFGGVAQVFEHCRGIGGMAAHVVGGLVVSGRNIAYDGSLSDKACFAETSRGAPDGLAVSANGAV